MIDEPFRRERGAVDDVEEGYYLLDRHSSGRVAVPIRIWFGPPTDPVSGDVLDRSWRWQIEINGHDAGYPEAPARIGYREVHDLDGIWPNCAKHRIDEAEYRFRVSRAVYAEDYDPNDPFGKESGRVDPMTATLPDWGS